MKIITITLNPAFDMHCSIDDFKILKENYATDVSKCAGGKGINISRALCSYGVENIAYCVVGTSNGREFIKSVEKDELNVKAVMTEGSIRENITIHSKSGETRLSFEGFSLDDSIFDKLYSMLKEDVDDDTVVTFTGRLCPGLSKSSAIEFLTRVKSMGAKLIVDSNSLSLEDLLFIKPFLIKPNEQEISELNGAQTIDEFFETATFLYENGIENVLISLGGDGLVYCGERGLFKVTVPHITPISTIGAGDSTIAGYICAMSENLNTEDTLKMASSFGTSACLTQGTNPPQKETITKIFGDIVVEEKM